MKSVDFYLVCVAKNMCNWQVKHILVIAFAILHVFFSCFCCAAQATDPSSIATIAPTATISATTVSPSASSTSTPTTTPTNESDANLDDENNTRNELSDWPGQIISFVTLVNNDPNDKNNTENAPSDLLDWKAPDWYGEFISFITLANAAINASFSIYVNSAKLSVRGFPSIDILLPRHKVYIKTSRIASFITICLAVWSSLFSTYHHLLFLALISMISSAIVLWIEIWIVSFNDSSVKNRLKEILRADLKKDLCDWENAVSKSLSNSALEDRTIVSTSSISYNIFINQCIYDGWLETVNATDDWKELTESLLRESKSMNYITMAGYIQWILLHQSFKKEAIKSCVSDTISAYDIIRKNVHADCDEDSYEGMYLAYDIYVYTTYITMLQFICEQNDQTTLLSFIATNLPAPLSDDEVIKNAFSRLRALAGIIVYERLLSDEESKINTEGILYQTGAYNYFDEFDFTHGISYFKYQSPSSDASHNLWYDDCTKLYYIQKVRQEDTLS